MVSLEGTPALGSPREWSNTASSPVITRSLSMDQQLLQPLLPTNPLVFLEITIGKEFAGRMVIELRRDVVPRAAENFRGLCTGEYGVGKLGKPLHYKGIRFHKVTRVYVAQSGDVVNNDGSCGESIYGPHFEDENFDLEHEEGVISMANYGKPNTNNSQFIVTLVACENLNGTNVVVGRVLRGLSIINDMEEKTSNEGRPQEDIIITDCGEIPPGTDWGYGDNDETADKLPPYPTDWERKFDVFTIDEMIENLTCIRTAGNTFFTQQQYHAARRKYRKANRYYIMLHKRNDWPNVQIPKCTDDDLKRLDDFAVINNINMAAVELKLMHFVSAAKACTEAIRLNKYCSKAYYRRGTAQIELNNYEEAISDLKRANELTPNNKQIVDELNRARKLWTDYNRKQMSALKNLFT